MASLLAPAAPAQLQLIRKNGDVLPLTAIQDSKSKVRGEVLVKGEVLEETYRAAIHRWNEAYIIKAVRFYILYISSILTCYCSQSSSSANPKRT